MQQSGKGQIPEKRLKEIAEMKYQKQGRHSNSYCMQFGDKTAQKLKQNKYRI